jgi:carbon monoxide dehydrogenase subunit G
VIKIASSFDVAAPPARVFETLVDPSVLRRCIPGCEDLKTVGPDTFEATLKLGLGGIKGRYVGRAELRDRQPPHSFALTFDGKGTTGFVRGAARVQLAETVASDAGADAGVHTRVTIDSEAQVGGAIAAVGSRLIEAAARKLSADFFRQLEAEITSGVGRNSLS